VVPVLVTHLCNWDARYQTTDIINQNVQPAKVVSHFFYFIVYVLT